jgi:hypothetical protein
VSEPEEEDSFLNDAHGTKKGQEIIDLLGLKPVGRSHREYGMDPPRYATDWGTKTALGLYRSIMAIVETQPDPFHVFCQQVNSIGRRWAEEYNRHSTGLWCKHVDIIPIFLEKYYEMGLTPKQTFKLLHTK